MKRITPEDLQRVAFRNSGPLISPEGMKVPERQAAPPSDPVLRKAVESSTEAAQNIALLVAALAADMRAAREAIAKPVTAWNFDVVRDDDGQMQTIVATAVR